MSCRRRLASAPLLLAAVFVGSPLAAGAEERPTMPMHDMPGMMHDKDGMPAMPGMPGMPGMHATDPSADSAGPAAQEFAAANAKMHKEMSIAYSGKPDVDFARGMIPHHQGAIDMANVVLKYGTDPEIKKLAEDVIKAQEAEIAFMKAWLAKQPQ